MELSNCITDDIKRATMIIWGSNQRVYVFNDFPLFFLLLLVFVNTQFMQKKIICIFDHKIKGMYVS